MVTLPSRRDLCKPLEAKAGALVLHADVPRWPLGSSLEWSLDSDLRRAQRVGQGATEPCTAIWGMQVGWNRPGDAFGA